MQKMPSKTDLLLLVLFAIALMGLVGAWFLPHHEQLYAVAIPTLAGLCSLYLGLKQFIIANDFF